MGGNPIAFTMSGSISIPFDVEGDSEHKNDIELASGKVIKITGALTRTDSNPIATINPGSYSRGRTVFEAASPVTDLSAYQDYFAFKVAGWKTKLSDDKTKLMLDSPIYVAGQSIHPTCGKAGSASGDGSLENPLDTIKNAVNVIKALPDAASTDYTILIDGELKPTVDTNGNALHQDISNSDVQIHSLTIKGANGLDSNGDPIDVINGQADATHRARGITFDTDKVPVTIECLKITNGLADQGGGIYLSNGSKLTLGDNVLVTGNTANNSGGGIALLSGSTLIVKDSATIANNRALGATGKGGAVFVGSGSSITISDSIYIPYGFRDSGIGYTGAGCNDIYLDTEKTVKIGGALSRHSSTDKIRINLPASAYKLKTKVLELVSSPSPATSLADEYEKFALVNESFVNIKATGLTGYSETITSFYVSADGSDDNLGKTEASAYKTIANALKRITSQESAEDYTINIIGTLTGAQTIPASDTSDTEYPITLNADTVKTLTLCGVGSDAKLNGGFNSDNKGTTLTISTPQKVTIKDLTITGGYSDGHGGGICIDENADVHISEGTKIVQNTALYGAGVYLYKAKLTMSGGIINKNTAQIYSSGFNSGYGGGIYLTGEGAKLLIYGNSFIGEDVAELPTDTSYGNKAYDYGGGIYCNLGGSVILGYSSYESESDNTPAEFTGKICRNYAGSSNSSSGGIVVKGPVIIASGTISYNRGTAISVSSGGSLKMTGGTIEYNYSNNGNPSAAGIYITESADVTITGAKINNNTGVLAGGIYLNSGTLSLGDDVIITENKARYGGGIYCSSSGLNVRGNVQIFGNIDEAETPNPANVYLYNQSDSRTITVTGALVNSSDSSKTAKIGITSKKNPTLVAPITVTKDYSKYNSVNPGKYFQSDTSSYGVTFDSDEKEARLAQSGGSLIIEPIYEDITISADKTSFSKAAASKVIKFSARGKDSDGNETSLEIGIGTGKVGLSIAAITSHGETVPSDGTYYSLSGNNLTLEDKLPAGNYTVSVTASYKDRTYSASFTVKINKALSASEAITAISAMTSSGTIAVAGAITTANISSLKEAISNLGSGVNVDLDLSEVTGLTILTSNAFKGCTHLSGITFPSTLEEIKDYAFEGCTGLTSIKIPDSVTLLGNSSFDGCSGITSYTLPDNDATTYQNRIFGGWKISELIVSKGHFSGSAVIADCNTLKILTLPADLGNYPIIHNCSGITTINYLGTRSQWDAKKETWLRNLTYASTITVHCSDD